jgi:hypothetical protein
MFSSRTFSFTHVRQEILITPKVGMTFQSDDDAYDMYNDYARKVGFNIRKSTIRYIWDKS